MTDMEENPNLVTLIRSPTDYVAAEVTARPSDPDYWDGNWCMCTVNASLGLFRTTFQAYLRTDEFEHYLRDLQKLNASLSGEAKFEAMEGQVRFRARMKSNGQIEVEGTLVDVCGIGNRLNFQFETDQTFLPPLIGPLQRFLGKYPVRDLDKKIAHLRFQGPQK